MAEAQRSEWAANWPLLLAAIIGVPVPVAMSSLLGQFMGPLEQEFGWTRTEVSYGYAISLVLGFIASPMVGRLVDKTNARLLALPGIVLTALAMAAFSLTPDNIGVWIVLWCAVSLVGSLTGPTVWLAVVSAAFEKNRSLAISLTLSGMSLATMLAPISGRMMIDMLGWRTAWIALAAIWCVPAFILALMFFHDRRPAARPTTQHQTETLPKSETNRALLSPTFIRIGLAVLLVSLAGASIQLHLYPALVEKGIGATTAAAIAGSLGAAAIVGKLGMGTLFDRMGQTTIILGVLSLYAVAGVIFAQNSDSQPLAIAGCIALGLGSGGWLVAIACIITRVFPPTVFGGLYGMVMALSTLAAAIGPLLVSKLHDIAHSYTPAFWAGAVIALVASLLMLKLPPVVTPEAPASG